MIPIFKGLAFAIFAKTFVGVNYFIIVMSWCLYYICAGMQSKLPWDTCVDEWNTRDCYSKGYDEQCDQSKEIFWNFECSNKTDYCQVSRSTVKYS